MSGRAHAVDAVPGLRALAGTQSGVVRRDQLAALGVTRHHIRRQVEAGRWRLIGDRVVVLSTGALTRLQQMQVAAQHAGPRGRLAGRTALEREGFQSRTRRDLFIVVERGVHVPPLTHVVVHRALVLPEHHVVAPNPPSCTVARATVDAASWEIQPRVAAGLVIAVLQQRLVTPDLLTEVLDLLPRARHSVVIRRAIADATGGSESTAEVRVLTALRAAGLRDIRRQVPVELSSGSARLDLVVRLPDGRMLVVHVDGPHHQEPAQQARDAALDAELVALGYVVLRLPLAALADPRWIRERLAALAVPRPVTGSRRIERDVVTRRPGGGGGGVG